MEASVDAFANIWREFSSGNSEDIVVIPYTYMEIAIGGVSFTY
jgi:hypothetical protein